MAKLGSKGKPAIVKVQTEERAMEMMAVCNENGWQVIVGIEPDEKENIADIIKLGGGTKPGTNFKMPPANNAPCPCGSGKKYKRCCGI